MRIANKKAGFTLIELVVVITLLGILGSLAVASFGGVREAVRDEAAYKKLDSIEDAFLYARTTNDFDNDKAETAARELVSVDGNFDITFPTDDSYRIVYTEINGKDYIVENGLYNYQKPEDNVEEEKPVDNSVKEFLGLANDLFLQTALLADIITKERDPSRDTSWIVTLKRYIEENNIKDANGNPLTVDEHYWRYAMGDYISKFYYNGSWPIIPGAIADALQLDTDSQYYLRPLIDDGTVHPDPNSIVLYASLNQGNPDSSGCKLIFLGKRRGTSDNYTVEGAWYQAPSDFYSISPASIGSRYNIESTMKMYGWQPVNFEKLDFEGGV